ncbi:MAG: Uma2 family endonuclease [Lachnospiraceae bacterium]|nr:Uma2 family endonuclease [Lachnospiraceae bacterium]
MTIDEMQTIKTEFGLTYDLIAENSGVPLGTVQKVLSGTTRAPRLETVRRLTAYFERLAGQKTQKQTTFSYADLPKQTPEGAREASPAYADASLSKRQGEYTLDDYLALPDDVRAELIDGEIFLMSSPGTVHQAISGKLLHELVSYIDIHGGSCIPFSAPTDVQLDCDDKTIVQPDVFIVCDRSKITPLRIFGAPDFIIEILSPSTWEKDMFIKGRKYKNAGVREYWLIDPKRKVVLVYRFERDDAIEVHTFDEKVEVGIFQAEDPADRLFIDFREISDYISFIPES